MPRTRILLVRHGATPLLAEDRFAGAIDVPLSADGECQAKLLASRLSKTCRVAAVYASPMIRTVKTATTIADPFSLHVQTRDGLKEISHGIWEGKTRKEVSVDPKYESWNADPFLYAPPEGESGLQVLARALPTLQEIVARHPDETVVIVSHKATIRLLISSILGFDPRRYRDVLDMSPWWVGTLGA